ncbi:thyroid transcription factor 1-associated protein 26 homolog [Megalops cyprinoides]|uniref:thyroid transcription factor 1-associated protein 26 homolog n=1 Tax=Megalops cyprinoides TaxID=118141 RepID=UPI001864F613|nr:thyroid transcription factor 1-associated protein 26 homolog [Megalops cyprinoides]
MAPFHKFAKHKGKQTAENANQIKRQSSDLNKHKRKWVPEGKVFDGSVQEGQGFAFKRKQKAQHEYNKLLRKEKRWNPLMKMEFEEHYPDHLKHLYLAEAEKLRKEDKISKLRRMKVNSAHSEEDDSVPDTSIMDATLPSPLSSVHEDSAMPSAPQHMEEEPYRNNRSKKKMRKLTSYQKTKDKYERIQAKRAKKKEEALRNKRQREEALRVYKQKKMQTYQILSKKTKKGQPNLNLQMEYLLQKIQNQTK